jgi:hypothetical protein
LPTLPTTKSPSSTISSDSQQVISNNDAFYDDDDVEDENDESDDIDDDDGEVIEANTDNDSDISDSADENDIKASDSLEGDTISDDDDDVQDSANLFKLITNKKENDANKDSKSMFSFLFEKSTTVGYYIVALTCLILVLIVVLVVIIVRLQMSKADAKGFVLYDEEDCDDTSDGSGNRFGGNYDNYSTVSSKQNLVESMLKKGEMLSGGKHFGYNVLSSSDGNFDSLNTCPKVIVVECDTKKKSDSITAALVDSPSTIVETRPNNVLSIKENPLGNVV